MLPLQFKELAVLVFNSDDGVRYDVDGVVSKGFLHRLDVIRDWPSFRDFDMRGIAHYLHDMQIDFKPSVESAVNHEGFIIGTFKEHDAALVWLTDQLEFDFGGIHGNR